MATNTVPIEIVLQDPNDPIVPTPDSDGGSTNTNTNSNIAVPNTALGEGHTTTDGSSNTGGFFSSSSAGATIIPIVVLTLALGAIVAILIHRYRKNKQLDNANHKQITKKEKLAIAATSTMAVLAATVLVGQLLMTTTNAATSSEGTELVTPDKIQIIANRYDDVTIVASTKAVSYATTDTSFGYKIFMSMAGEDGNLYLNGDTSEEYYFAPTTRAGLSNNSWGYSLDDGAEQAMPLSDNAIMAQQNTSAASDDEFDVYYSMKADKDMPFGVYSGEIAYDIEGYNGFPSTLTTMQGMASEICDATYTPNAFKADGVTIEDNVPTATLTDIRDNKTYTIAKLADGKCWMTQNLDLQKEDLLQGVTLDSTNTDNPASGFVLPDSQTSGQETWGRYNDKASIDTEHVYDVNGSGQEYYYCSRYDSGPGQCIEYSDVQIPPAELGNYYNWYTATAGTGIFDITQGEATGSICPKGWGLPDNSGSVGRASYGELLYLYGILSSPTERIYDREIITKLFMEPFSFIPAGIYNADYGGANSIGSISSLWSSRASGNSGARALALNFTSMNPNDSRNRYFGSSVRCVAK